MGKIDNYAPGSGRKLRENDDVVNVADILSSSLSGKAKNFEQLTIDNTVGGKSLTENKYGWSTKSYITVEMAQIRFRVDGGTPTASVGHVADISDTITLDSREDIVNFKAIRTGTVSAVINVTYSN